MVLIIIAQVNLLLSKVNDMLDIKLIAEGKFTQKNSVFNPKSVLDFI